MHQVKLLWAAMWALVMFMAFASLPPLRPFHTAWFFVACCLAWVPLYISARPSRFGWAWLGTWHAVGIIATATGGDGFFPIFVVGPAGLIVSLFFKKGA